MHLHLKLYASRIRMIQFYI